MGRRVILLVFQVFGCTPMSSVQQTPTVDLPWCPPERKREVLIPTDVPGVFTKTGTISLCDGTSFLVAGHWEQSGELFVAGKDTGVSLSPIWRDGVSPYRSVRLLDGTSTDATLFCFFDPPKDGEKVFRVELTVRTSRRCPAPGDWTIFHAECRKPQTPLWPCNLP